MNKWKRFIYFLLFIAGFNFFEHFAHKKTDGFSLQRIRFSSEPVTKLQLGDNVKEILQQPFHYLDCGNQCFVFVSEDGNYVLKFFKYASPTVLRFMTTIPLLNRFKPLRPHRYAKTVWKKQRDFQGYQLAYDRFQSETGLIALHLHPTQASFPQITLIDKLHITHQLDLNTAPFVLQKRATPVYKQLRRWIASGETHQAIQGVTALMQLLKKRMTLELQDDDVHFYSNFGFVGQTAIQTDPGHFTQGTSPHPLLELETISHELKEWCEKNAPFLTLYIENETLAY